MDPRRNLEVAEALRDPDSSVHAEASYRASCSRAYYAAFGHAREVLDRAGIPTDGAPGMSAHARVASALKGSTVGQVRAAGFRLERLHSTRKQADYDVGTRAAKLRHPIDETEAERASETAVRIVERIERARPKDKALGVPNPGP